MPGPKEGERCDFFEAVLHFGGCEDQQERLGVEVDPRHSHEGVEDVVLVRDQEAGGSIKRHGSPVVLGVERGEEVGGDGHDGEVLNVGVVRQTVGRDVVHVVRPLLDREGCSEVKMNRESGGDGKPWQPQFVDRLRVSLQSLYGMKPRMHSEVGPNTATVFFRA